MFAPLPRVHEYEVLVSPMLPQLASQVVARLNVGWQLVGGVAVEPARPGPYAYLSPVSQYFQAVTRSRVKE